MRKQPRPAEARDLRKGRQNKVAERADALRLLHEREVYQIELEMHNEELRATRTELEAERNRYTELFHLDPSGHAHVTPDGTIREINLVGARLLGTGRSRLIGCRLGAFIATEDVPTFNQALQRAAESEVREICEINIDSEWGGSRLRLTASRLIGAEPRLLLAMEEASGHPPQDEQLIHQRALGEANQRIDDFRARLSQELSLRLAPIRSSLARLFRAMPASEQGRQAQASIEREVAQLARFVDDLRDVTRNKLELTRQSLDLGELVRQTLEDHCAGFAARGVRLETHLAPGPYSVSVDAARLAHAIDYLLSNALESVPRGGVVTVSLQREGRAASLRVRDSGAGIARQSVEHLRVSVGQANETVDRARGRLARGLARVNELIEPYGGAVALASNGLGKGATAALALPLDPPPAASVEIQPSPSKRRVLIIDDNPDRAESLAEAVALEGLRVKVAHDGPSGLEAAREYRPDVVLCKLALPGMDGYRVARALRRDGTLRDACLIALTGRALPRDLHRLREAGFDQNVAEPVAVNRLAGLLGGAEGRREARGRRSKPR